MERIFLQAGKACKCSCREYLGAHGKKYWVDIRTNTVYTTDCHKKNPTKASGVFVIINTTEKVIDQSSI